MDTLLKIKMNELHISNRKMAERLHVSRCTISSWKCGKYPVGTFAICDVCAMLGVSIEYLFGGEDKGWTDYDDRRLSPDNIAYNIKWFREKAGMNQKQLAETIAANVATVYKWEQGKTLPKMDYIPDLCEGLGITIRQLFA